MAKKLSWRRMRVLKAKADQHDRVRAIMDADHTPHKTIAGYVQDIRDCLRESERELREANGLLGWIDQLRRDEDYHDTHTLEEFITTLFCKIKSIDAVVSEARAAQDENARLKEALRSIHRISEENTHDN